MSVAIVTGANKGIGYHIAAGLLESKSHKHVILGCRDATRAEAAQKKLGGGDFLQLDLGNGESIMNFASSIKEKYGRADLLVNNAAFAFKNADPTPFEQQTGPTLKINYYGTMSLTNALLPLILEAPHPRIVNVASGAGRLGQVSAELQEKFSSNDLTLEGLDVLVEKFQNDVAAKTHKANGWSSSNYGMSKLALIAATKVLARKFPKARINSCCPGYCDTDMTSHKGPRPPAVGAKNALVLCDIPDDGPTGEFWKNMEECKW